MNYLRQIRLEVPSEQQSQFPFSIASNKINGTLDIPSAVTFFVGENGTGKSTILEGIAASLDLPTIGNKSICDDETLTDARKLAQNLRLIWNKRSLRGFFLRTEDFFNFSRLMAQMIKDLDEDLVQYEEMFSGYGLQLAKGSTLAQKEAIIEKYGENLDANSHGEAIMQLLIERLTPSGLYLLDEPEIAFAPNWQLALISLIKKKVEEEKCQFIICTHSPILLAMSEATIYSFDNSPISKANYEDLEHVNLTRDFLNNPGAYLRRL